MWVGTTVIVIVFVFATMMLASVQVSHASFWDDPFGKSSHSSTNTTTTSSPTTSSPTTSSPASTINQSPVNSNCDTSYPDFCIAPPQPDPNRADVPQKRFTVTGSDPHGFDRDGDGIGCES